MTYLKSVIYNVLLFCCQEEHIVQEKRFVILHISIYWFVSPHSQISVCTCVQLTVYLTLRLATDIFIRHKLISLAPNCCIL